MGAFKVIFLIGLVTVSASVTIISPPSPDDPSCGCRVVDGIVQF